MRRASGLSSTGILALGLAGLAAVCCVWTWMAYTYLFGTSVSVSIGDECLGKYQNGTAGTIDCWDASWPLDGSEQVGTLVDYRQAGGMFEYDVIQARAFGDVARTQPAMAPYAAGLAGPVLLLGALAVGSVALRRRSPQSYRMAY